MTDDISLLAELLESPTVAGALIEHGSDLSAVVSGDRPQWRAALPELSAEAFERVSRKLEAIREAALALRWRDLKDRDAINNREALTRYLGTAISGRSTESFHTLYLDRQNRVIAHDRQEYGTVDHVAVYPREVILRALELSASALILAHNHPSGDPTPSPADIAMTRDIRAAASALGILLYDHIVIGHGNRSSSLRDLNLI